MAQTNKNKLKVINISVLKYKRAESKAEYLNTAYDIYIKTINFLSRLSSRYSRLISTDVSRLASEVLDNAEKANSIFPSDDNRKQMRKTHLLEARASLMALDVHLSLCYEIMMLNPEGCFTTSNGKSVEKNKAEDKLDRMSQALGELIDKENNLLTAILKSDKLK